MTLFQYKALDSQGQRHQGVFEADSEREAKDKLRERNLMLTSLSIKAHASNKENLQGENLLAFTLQLSHLINAGLPLFESLQVIEEQYRKESYHRVILSLCDQIKRGASLSEAMKGYPESFSHLYCSMIAAGESVGALGLMLERLNQLLSKQMKMKKEIVTAMIYPAILSIFSLLIIMVLLGFVVPSIEAIFQDRTLNSFTNFVLGLSYLVRSYWWVYLPLILGGIASIFFFIRTPKGKEEIQKFLMKIPFIKHLLINTAVARFSRTMATLQQGGLPLIESLKMARQVMYNVVLEKEIEKIENKIIEGSTLGYEITHSRIIPTIVGRMLSVGEDSGSLLTMFQKIAEIYEESLEKSLNRVVAMAQPAILIFMGGIIGMVMLAILLPLSDIVSLVNN